MLGNICKTILVSIAAILFLSGCMDSHAPTPTSLKAEPIQFKQEPASRLLNQSKVLAYPEDFNFVPTFLGNDQFVYGYSIDEQSQKSSLISLNTNTNEYSLIKSVDIGENPVTFGTYYADEEYVLFNEYHYGGQESNYFLLNKQDGSFLEILSIPDVSPLHFTEISRWENTFIIVTSDSTGNYPIICYDLDSKESTVIESNNSGYPVVIGHTLYYLLLDNEQIKASLMSYDLRTLQKVKLSHTTGREEFYNGLYAYGNQLLTVKQSEKGMIFYEGYDQTSQELFRSEYAETISSYNGFLTFLGNNLTSEDGRLQYYLYDLDKKIQYAYDGSVMYLSDAGIFWVEYVTPEDQVGSGQVFSKEHSRMRFLKFQK